MASEKNGFILGISFPFWRRFVDESTGELLEDKLQEAGYTEEQIPDIRQQMLEAELLVGDEKDWEAGRAPSAVDNSAVKTPPPED